MEVCISPETQDPFKNPLTSAVQDLFSEQAARTPQAVALSFLQLQLTYSELEHASNLIAARLKATGIARGDIVGVALPRSVELITCLLGVLKAGATYLPLDIQYPRQHLAYVIEDAAPSAVIGTTEGVQALGELPPSITLLAIQQLLDPDMNSGGPPHTNAGSHPDDTAYVIYTSGSTGNPKGVAVTHHNIVRLLDVSQSALGFNNEDCWALFHSFAFDFSVWEIWGALLSGAELVIVPYSISRSPRDFLELLVNRRITVLNQTPSAFYQLDNACEDAPQLAAQLNLRCLIFGGETLDYGRLQGWRLRQGDQPRLINMYGITETTVHVTLHEISALPSLPVGVSPIGEALGDLVIHLLDTQLRPVETGVVAQIYVSGAGLSRGYLNRPALTAERFIACPFSDKGERMYRSGDLARRTTSGTLEYLGRADDQVKIRGHRIELGEITAHLLKHPRVKTAAVIARANKQGPMQLLAYVVPHATSRDASLDYELVNSWKLVYEETYRRVETDHRDSAFEGWNSSYDQQPLPLEEMRDWQRETLANIQRLNPCRVLEVGVGSGLILRELAPQTELYWGVDLSAVTVANLQRVIDATPTLQEKVKVFQGAAHQLQDLPPVRFDTIVVNSVTQYFPSLEYLDRLLLDLQDRLTPGGHLFVGDVRNHGLLHLFATGVIARRTPLGALSCSRAAATIEEFVAHEKELTIHPDYFAEFPNREDNAFSNVDIRLKQTHEINELTQYRYDVTLHFEGTPTVSLAEATIVDWHLTEDPLSKLKELLGADSHRCLRLRGVPYIRVAKEVAWQRSLADSVPWPHSPAPGHDDTDLQRLCALGEPFGYQGVATWSSQACDRIDIVFWRNSEEAFPVGLYQHAMAHDSVLANRPNSARADTQFRVDLQRWLQERLPPHMQPHAIVAVADLPLTSNGKLDKHALPAPSYYDGRQRGQDQAESPLEAALQRLICDILGLDGVSLSENFFQIGGDSLSAVSLAAAVRRELELEISLGDVFDAPSIRALAVRVQFGAQARPPLKSELRPERLPLSNAQRRLWLMAQVGREPSSYNIPLAFDIDGDLDVDALAGALGDVQRRHEVLRTIVGQDDDGLYQRILPPDDAAISLQQPHCPAEDLATSLTNLSRQPFDLKNDLPMRAWLINVGNQRNVLLLVMHHIAMDGWSIDPLLQELSLHYKNRVIKKLPVDLPPVATQYTDYVLWQQRMLGTGEDPSSVRHRQLLYWRETLRESPPVLSLPGSAHRPPEQSGKGGECFFLIEKPLMIELQNIANTQHSTLFMVLHTAVLTLLSRMGSGNDLSVAVALAGRSDEALKDSIGLFVNTVVVRTSSQGNPHFTTLLQRVRKASVGAYTNQDLPFDSLVEAMAPRRTLSHHPLFQVLLTLQDARKPTLNLPGAALKERKVSTATSRFDWTLDFRPILGQENMTDCVECRLEYASDLFDHAGMQTICKRFVGLLNSVAQDPARPIGDLALHLDDEQQIYLDCWNGQRVDQGALGIYARFEEQARRRPESIALVATDATLRYAELSERAGIIARHLQLVGGNRNLLVGIALRRTTTMVATLLGCLKAGVTYLPLDLGYPSERLKQIINDAAMDLIVGDDEGREHLARILDDTPWTDIDEWQALPEIATGEPWVYDPEQPAYLLYTSGSTGRPKGVLVTQRSLLNLLDSMGSDPGVSHADTLLACTPVSFDISALELFLPLINGGILQLASSDLVRDPIALIQRIHAVKPTVMQATPTLWQMLCDSGWKLQTPMKILCGGEALPSPLANRLSSPPGRLYNLYGPTETTVWSMLCELAPGQFPSLGKPIANTRIHILDSYLKAVVPGVLGEICIAGDGVVKGYLNNPALTAERFIADPHGPPGTRMYRTGDLGRWNTEGELHYCGRSDAQIKLRGHRIELGDIESLLCSHPGVSRAVVSLRQDAQARSFLVAHVVGLTGVELDLREIRCFLTERLPDHMVPARIGQVAELPLTPNGKVDRTALTLPAATGSGAIPTNATERQFIRFFENLLGVQGVGREDNFFELGGDSFLAVALAKRATEEGYALRPADVFQMQTVRDLTQRLSLPHSDQETSSRSHVLLPLRLHHGQPALFCFHPKEGVGLRFANLLPHLNDDQPVYAFQSSLLGANPHYADSVEALATLYMDEMRRIQPHGPYRLLGWSFGGLVAYQAAWQLTRNGEKVELLALLDVGPNNEEPNSAGLPNGQADDVTTELEHASDHHLALMKRFVAAPANVDILFFSCQPSSQKDQTKPGDWQKLTGCTVTTWQLDCQHGEMLDPQWASVIAHAVRTYLARPNPRTEV